MGQIEVSQIYETRQHCEFCQGIVLEEQACGWRYEIQNILGNLVQVFSIQINLIEGMKLMRFDWKPSTLGNSTQQSLQCQNSWFLHKHSFQKRHHELDKHFNWLDLSRRALNKKHRKDSKKPLSCNWAMDRLRPVKKLCQGISFGWNFATSDRNSNEMKSRTSWLPNQVVFALYCLEDLLDRS